MRERRESGNMPSVIDDATSRRDFEKRGFAVLRGVFSPDAARGLRDTIVQLGRDANPPSEAGDLLNLWQGVTHRAELWRVITHQPLVDAARALAGDDLRYAHNSEVHANNAGYLWHRDCLDQTRGIGPDWADDPIPYRIVRACIHLQDHAESGFRFGVVPGSHRAGARTPGGVAGDWYARLRRKMRLAAPRSDPRRSPRPSISMARSGIARLRPATPTWIAVGLGDCVLLHQRLVHSASEIRGPQYAIYFSYGPDDAHTRRQWMHFRHERRDRPQGRMPDELRRELERAGLLSELDRVDRD